jgi:hypothetical protein
VEGLFEKADDWVWKDLKEVKARFRMPAEGEKHEAYTLIDFEIVPGIGPVVPPGVANTFAFKHGFLYQWSIRFHEQVDKDQTEERELNPVTREPRVTQFIPCKGTSVTASVTVYRDEKSAANANANADGAKASGENQLSVQSTNFKTSASTRLKRLRGMRRGELLYLVITVVTAFTIGLQTDEFNAAQKGSWVALLILFAWGVAADQIKNALANLGPGAGK